MNWADELDGITTRISEICSLRRFDHHEQARVLIHFLILQSISELQEIVGLLENKDLAALGIDEE